MPTPLRVHRAALPGTFASALVSTGYLLAFRGGLVPARPAVFATLVTITALFAAASLVVALIERHMVAIVVCSGLLLVFAGGLANWLLSLQGFVILTELEAVPLTGGTHLQEFENGALSNLAEMNLTMQLERFELHPERDGFVPVSRIRLIDDTPPPEVMEVRPGRAATLGTLRFHQGAFGFAPRIVITRNGETLFDRYVPFTTRAHDRALSFEGAFDVAKEKLSVRGAISLEQLDDRMRGHPRLGLAVDRDGKPAGAGELQVGHFARLADGYAIGFAGVKNWSEIDVSRRNYPQPVFAGGALVILGLAVWPFTRRPR